MRLILTCQLLFLVIHNGKAQLNLIPNPSFELMDTCPAYGVSSYTLLNWFSPTDGTPDQFNSCITWYWGHRVPQSSWGYQYPKTGNGYAALFLCDPTADSVREYLSIKLIEPLKRNTYYCLTFYCNESGHRPSQSSTIGAYFSTDSIHQSGIGILPFSPQIENDTANYFDTTNWKPVSGYFKAIGGEKYMHVGNFKSNANTNLIQYDDGGIYLLIDEFTLYECDSLVAGIPTIPINKVMIYPNPASNNLSITIENPQATNIKFYDISGRQLFQKTLNNSTEHIDISNFEDGIYICAIIQNGLIVKREKFIISR